MDCTECAVRLQSVAVDIAFDCRLSLLAEYILNAAALPSVITTHLGQAYVVRCPTRPGLVTR